MSLDEQTIIDQFLRDELSQEDKTAFLKRIEADIDFREKFLLEKQMFESLDENDWSYASNIDKSEINKYNLLYEKNAPGIKKAISEASTTYNKQTKGKVRRLYQLSAIAAVLIIGLFVGVFYSGGNDISNQQLYANYIKIDKLPSLATRDSNDVNLIIKSAKDYYSSGAYDKAIVEYNKLLDLDKNNGLLYLYKAKSQLQIEDFTNAENTLDQLLNSNLIDAEKAYWYKALLYLKMDRIEESRTILNTIIENKYFNYQKAKELKAAID